MLRLRRALAPALAATLLLAACGAPGLDEEQATEEQRTCASLRERVAARSLEDAGVLAVPDGDGDKADGLSPVTLLEDPETWYTTLARAWAEAEPDHIGRPSPLSPASRLVDRCRQLEP